MTIQLSIKSYLKKYVESKYEMPFVLKESHLLMPLLLCGSIENTNNVFTDHESKIVVSLPSVRLSQIATLYAINDVFNKIFKQELYTYIDAQRECGITIQDSILRFYSKYEIDEEDLNIDTCFRGYQRYLDNLKRVREMVLA